MNYDTTMTVAVVDDELSLRETLKMALEQEGFEVQTYENGKLAWQVFCEKRPDLIILDVSMPYMDGLELCRRLRSIDQGVPVLFLSSKTEEIDRILGLELGGDDYLCKPFSLRELMVRVKVLLRRIDQTANTEEKLKRGDLTLDKTSYQAFWNADLLDLTVTEFNLLHKLALEPSRVWTRDQLMELIYGMDTFVSSRTIDTHIKRIRRKIEQAGGDSEQIQTVYGLGYRFKNTP
ncbi:response regulator transcription factor [Spirochaeta cellobiosiphila]|uniref:response regulator transcription factor n=1 Tax=Spirochaeta cellobiosiphila TaxID=504483 RepID=UPI000422EC4A|nr:response regulator transcription factor [Spirochaeta cellobiosiphila]